MVTLVRNGLTCLNKVIALHINHADIYLIKIINRNTRKSCEICSKLTIHQNDVVDVVLVFQLLTLIIFHTFF